MIATKTEAGISPLTVLSCNNSMNCISYLRLYCSFCSCNGSMSFEQYWLCINSVMLLGWLCISSVMLLGQIWIMAKTVVTSLIISLLFDMAQFSK